MSFEIHHHHYFHHSSEARCEVMRRLEEMSDKIDLVKESIMATLEDLEAAVTRNTNVDESVLTLLAGISQQLKDAQGNPAKIAEVIAKLDANTQKMADAVTANTPSA